MSRVKIISCFIVSLSMFNFILMSFADPPADKDRNAPSPKDTSKTTSKTKEANEAEFKNGPRLTVAEAREKAKLTHKIYDATLHAMHQHYFINERAAVPARVMENMFSDVEREENMKARWISVNTKAMSVDHEPDTDFEKAAAKEIASGKNDYERVENGVYQRAVAISLMNHGCLSCHVGFFKKNTKDRFAGLIISIPVKESESESETTK
tara:strand:+ start:153226 stop:153855 length:630 start_codon:yes stop_codon:yes gene_type:complete